MEDPQNIVYRVNLGGTSMSDKIPILLYHKNVLSLLNVLLQLLDAWVPTSMIHMKSCIYIYPGFQGEKYVYMYIVYYPRSQGWNLGSKTYVKEIAG